MTPERIARHAGHSTGSTWGQPLAFYYFVTPVYLLSDFAFGLNLRVSFLAAAPGLRIFYYLVCFTCGLMSLGRYRRYLPLAGLVECTLNILLLVLSVMIPVVTLPSRFMAQEDAGLPFSIPFFVNFVVSGIFFIYAFYTNPILRRSPWLRRY